VSANWRGCEDDSAAAPSFGRGALLYRLGHRHEHGQRQDCRPRAGIADLRALRPCSPVGQPRQRAIDLPRLQHQSRRRAGRRPRDAHKTITGERTAWHRPGFVPTWAQGGRRARPRPRLAEATAGGSAQRSW